MYALYVREGASPKAYMCVEGGGRGRFQKPELSCVSTSSRTRHGNINPFLFNALLMLLMMTSSDVER